MRGLAHASSALAESCFGSPGYKGLIQCIALAPTMEVMRIRVELECGESSEDTLKRFE